MPVLTTRLDIPEEVSNIYLMEHLMMETSENVMELFAKKLPVSSNKGTKTIRVRRLNTLNPATTPITEGVTPNGSKATVVNIDVRLNQYGDYVQFSDVINTTSLDDVILDLSKVTGQQKASTKNILCRNALLAGTNVVYAGGKTNRSGLTTADKLNAEMLEQVEKTLKKWKAKKITRMVSSTDASETTPIDACYVGFVSIEGASQLKNLAKFTPVEKYAQNTKTFPNEIGKYGSIRYIETDAIETINGSVKVEQLVAFGEEAYGTGEMKAGGNGELIIKNLGETGEDPLNQRWSVGWKDDLGFKILNEKFLVRGEFAM